MKKLVLAAALGLVCLANARGAFAQTPTAAPGVIGSATDTEKAEELRLKAFDLVWSTVKEKHFDPTFGGVNWDQVREQYQPRAAAASTNAELYRVLQEMLGELHQSHFNIIPPEAIIADNETQAGGGIGVDLRMINGMAILTRVEPESPAFLAGLRSGFIIKQVGDTSVDQIIQVAKNTGTAKTESSAKAVQSALMSDLRITRRILGAMSGAPGSSVKIIYLDAKDQQHEAEVKRESLKGELSPRFGNFPPQYTEFETRRIADGGTGIGYIRFNIFTTPVITKVREALTELHDADGIIFDLRGNPGGVGGIALGMSGQLSLNPGSLGTMKMRTSEMKFAFFPQTNAYAGPVAILIDGMSASTSELFSAGMQEMGRAVVIGERSLGACLPSYLQKLPTGAMFQFAIADFRTPKGVLIEGRGVLPDVEIKRDRAALLAGRDAQLDAAVESLRRSKRLLPIKQVGK